VKFWVNDYSNRETVSRDLFDTNSGNCHDITYIGHIQFEKAINKNKSSKQFSVNFFNSNKCFELADNINPNTGAVKPLTPVKAEIIGIVQNICKLSSEDFNKEIERITEEFDKFVKNTRLE